MSPVPLRRALSPADPALVPRTRRGAKVDDDEEEVEEEMKRMLGLVILRGETIVTLSVEGPPPAVDESRGPGLQAGPGSGAPAGRGMGLQAPTMCVVASCRTGPLA